MLMLCLFHLPELVSLTILKVPLDSPMLASEPHGHFPFDLLKSQNYSKHRSRNALPFIKDSGSPWGT